MSGNDTPNFHRTGFTSPLGKLDGWLPEARIENAVLEKFQTRVAEACAEAGVAGKPAAEALRDMVRVAALGPDTAAKMYGEGVLVVVKTIGRLSDTN